MWRHVYYTVQPRVRPRVLNRVAANLCSNPCASPSRRSATAYERCSQRSSKPSIAREATNQRVSGRLAIMSNTDLILAGTAEYVVGHPIYAFYRHLWREDRVLFAKVASVAFIHGLDLLYSVPYLYVAEQVPCLSF